MVSTTADNAFSSCTLKLVDAAIQGPSGGMSRGVPLLFGSFDAMKSPVGFRGYEGASFRVTQLNKHPAGLRATMSGATLVVPSGADGDESSLKTPISRRCAGDRRVKMATYVLPPQTCAPGTPAHPGKAIRGAVQPLGSIAPLK